MGFLLLFGLVGVVGNGTLVCIVLFNPDMRSVPNILIASLGLGDFLVLISSVPFTFTSYLFIEYQFGMSMCKFSNVVPIISHGVSVFTLAALSYDRYTAIVRPMQRRQSNAVMRTYILSILIWCVSILLGIPSGIVSQIHIYEDQGTSVAVCVPFSVGSVEAKVHLVVKCVIMFIGPLAMISCYYLLIALQLYRSSRAIPCEGQTDSSRQLRARRRLARTVLVLVVIFAICWIPHFIYR